MSSRARYEVLRRDGFRCRYCGATAQDDHLEVDHVIPVSLGGDNTPSNLVTACQTCNSGKSSVAPDQDLVDDVAADALRWSRALQIAAEVAQAERDDWGEVAEQFCNTWAKLAGRCRSGPVGAPTDWEHSLRVFFNCGLTEDDVLEYLGIAMAAHQVANTAVWKYFCGICWRNLEQRREQAAAIIAAGGADSD